MSLIESIEDGKLCLSCLDIVHLNTQMGAQVSLIKIVKANLNIDIF